MIHVNARAIVIVTGDDSLEVHWASVHEINTLNNNVFSEIDKPAIMLFKKERVS
jgi:hypothetical protein